jgi:hypothetical protein
MTIKKSSVVEDDVQDNGIRAGAVVPLPMSAHVSRDGRLAETGQFLKNQPQ